MTSSTPEPDERPKPDERPEPDGENPPATSSAEQAGRPAAGESASGTDRAASDSEASAVAAAPEGKKQRKQRPLSQELPVLLVVAIALALLLKAFVVQAFYIPSGSMERTLLIQDRVLVNKVTYRFRDIHRGEIVVFNGSGTGFTQSESVVPPPSNAVGKALRSVQRVLGLGAPGERDFVKRVIGVGGDTVACCDAQGRVTVNGVPLDEPYVFENNPLDAGRTFAPFTVPKGDLWVMGDHRGDSGDSRINGPIPTDRVIGRAFVRVWPLDRLGVLRVPDDFSKNKFADGPIGAGAALGLVVVPALLPALGRRRRR